jgi:hypothetical protein
MLGTSKGRKQRIQALKARKMATYAIATTAATAHPTA